jgi:hypothetical protein
MGPNSTIHEGKNSPYSLTAEHPEPRLNSGTSDSKLDFDRFEYEFGASVDLQEQATSLRAESESVDALIVEEERRHDVLLDDVTRTRQLTERTAREDEAALESLRAQADAECAARTEHCARAIAHLDRAISLGPVLPRVAEERAVLSAAMAAAAGARDARLEAQRRDSEERAAGLAAALELADAAMRASEAALSALADRRERLRRRLDTVGRACAEARRRDEEVRTPRAGPVRAGRLGESGMAGGGARRRRRRRSAAAAPRVLARRARGGGTGRPRTR